LGILGHLNDYLLLRLFENKDEPEPPEGLYGVWLCNNYIWRCFVIDDAVPVGEDGQPKGLVAEVRQLWVPLLIKALALCLGGYVEL
jgi:hypothetical protein